MSDLGTGLAKVETLGGLALVGPVTDATARTAVGDPVTVAIRPEGFRVEPDHDGDASAEPGWIAQRGRVLQGLSR